MSRMQKTDGTSRCLAQNGNIKRHSLNKLFSLNLPIRMATACTKHPRVIHISTSDVNGSRIDFNLVDLPGIAESINADMIYSNFYKKYLNKASVLLCLSQSDTRAYKQDEIFYRDLIENGFIRKSTFIILGINQIDLLFKTSENPDGVDLKGISSDSELIKEKIRDYYNVYSTVFRDFPGIASNNVVPFSAIQGWNLSILKELIINNL